MGTKSMSMSLGQMEVTPFQVNSSSSARSPTPNAQPDPDDSFVLDLSMDNPRDPQQQREDSNNGLGDLSFNTDFNMDSAAPFVGSGQADASFFGGSDDGYDDGGAAD